MYKTGDFLIQIKNAYRARKKELAVDQSKTIFSIAKILEKEGYVGKVKSQKSKVKNTNEVVIELLYKERIPAVSDIKLVSKPSIHYYVPNQKLGRIVAKNGIGIVSTSQGLMTNKEAIKKGLGGEVICQIY